MPERCNPPILPAGPLHTLILGSFPSKRSVIAAEYYAHPQNHFWRVLEACGVVPDATAPYPQRTQRLTEQGFGLWDLYGAIVRAQDTSADSDLRAHVPNDIPALWAERGPFRVVLNGKRGREWRRYFGALPVDPVEAPSTSPRPQHWNTPASRRAVLAAWRGALRIPTTPEHPSPPP